MVDTSDRPAFQHEMSSMVRGGGLDVEIAGAGDLTTEDRLNFYRHGGGHVLTLQVREPPRHVGERGTRTRDAEAGEVSDSAMWRQLGAHMDKEKFWPNVWFISDHGNAHLMQRPKRKNPRAAKRQRIRDTKADRLVAAAELGQRHEPDAFVGILLEHRDLRGGSPPRYLAGNQLAEIGDRVPGRNAVRNRLEQIHLLVHDRLLLQGGDNAVGTGDDRVVELAPRA